MNRRREKSFDDASQERWVMQLIRRFPKQVLYPGSSEWLE